MATCLAVGGCGRGSGKTEKTYPVSGVVTLDGQPLAEGEIYFRTVKTGMFDKMSIKDGKFKGEAQTGTRKVEISAFREPKLSPEQKKIKAKFGEQAKGMVPTRENFIPAKYNSKSKLSAEVKTDGANEFTFPLTSR